MSEIAEAPVALNLASDEGKAADKKGNGTVRILVVDDEPDLELLIKQRFRKRIRASEFEFQFAANGVEALEALADGPGIDIVLTDINMPVMDGLTLLGKMSALDRLLKSVVILEFKCKHDDN